MLRLSISLISKPWLNVSLTTFLPPPSIVLGFAFQTSLRWRLPFPVNIILLPVTILETFLYYYVAA